MQNRAATVAGDRVLRDSRVYARANYEESVPNGAHFSGESCRRHNAKALPSALERSL